MLPAEEVSFPAELQDFAIAARKEEELPERWMCIVVRREVMTKAMGKIVHRHRVSQNQLVIF
jgi:hypothetical protein